MNSRNVILVAAATIAVGVAAWWYWPGDSPGNDVAPPVSSTETSTDEVVPATDTRSIPDTANNPVEEPAEVPPQTALPMASAANPYPDPADRPRLEFDTAYSRLASLKLNVAEIYASSGRFPHTYLEAKLDGPIVESYFTIELGTEGMLKVTFNGNADPVLIGTDLAAMPVINEFGDIVWHCDAPRIPKDVRSQGCR
jgi:hypothetical protein